jgi:hypothetical protein
MRAGVTENHRLLMLADLMANGRLKHQFATGFEPEINRIIDGAGHPVSVSDAGNCSETHAGEVLDHAQDHRHRVNAADGVDVGGQRPGWS